MFAVIALHRRYLDIPHHRIHELHEPIPPSMPHMMERNDAYHVTVKNALYYEDASLKSRKVGALYANADLQVTGESGDFYAFRTGPNTCYISKKNAAPGGGSKTGPAGLSNDVIVSNVRSKLGCPYKPGAMGPNAFDCSGLIRWAYSLYGVALNSVAGYQCGVGRILNKGSMVAGDCIYIDTKGDGKVHHCAVFIGGGQMIHAPCEGDVVKISPLTTHPILQVRRYF